MKTKEQIQQWLRERIAQELKAPLECVSTTTLFTRYGFDSVIIVTLAVDLEEWLETSLDPTIFWEFPTIEALSEWLLEEHLPSVTR